MLKYLSKKMIARFVLMIVACGVIFYMYIPFTSGEIPMKVLTEGTFYFDYSPPFKGGEKLVELPKPELVLKVVEDYHDVEVIPRISRPAGVLDPYVHIVHDDDMYRIYDLTRNFRGDIRGDSAVYIAKAGDGWNRGWLSMGSVKTEYLLELENLYLEMK